MFKCELCNKISQAYEKQCNIITEKRNKTYHYYIIKIRMNRGKTKQITSEVAPDSRDKNKQIVREFTSHGWETSKAIKVCEVCLKNKGDKQ